MGALDEQRSWGDNIDFIEPCQVTKFFCFFEKARKVYNAMHYFKMRRFLV